jgi:hypothetical protein
VSKKSVGQVPQSRQFLFPAHDRLFAEIAAGHDQRPKFAAREQQMMQRRIGQHYAEVREAGRDSGRNHRLRTPAQQYDGPARAGQLSRRFVIHQAKAGGVFEAAYHQGEGLVAAPLPLA